MSSGERLPAAWRLICTVDRDGVRVRSRRRVHMTTPPSDPLDGSREPTGFWVEVRDAGERVQYRRAMTSPVEDEVEVPGDPAEGTFTRVGVEPRGTFALLVPETDDADHVALLRAAPVSGGRARRTELARVSLRADTADERDPGREGS